MKDVSAMLAHGAWAEGSSWTRVIAALKANAVNVLAAPLRLISLADDVAALNRSLERTEGPSVLARHAYAGAVIARAARAGEGADQGVRSRSQAKRHRPDSGGRHHRRRHRLRNRQLSQPLITLL